MIAETSDINIRVGREFSRRHTGISKDSLLEGVLTSDWERPLLESKARSWLPGIGTTVHRAMPTSFKAYSKSDKVMVPIDVIAKPFSGSEGNFLAEREFHNIETAISRGVNVPPVVALVNIKNADTFLLTELMRAVQPLGVRRVDYQFVDDRVFPPDEFLAHYLGAIAEMHDAGTVHGTYILET